MVSRKTLIQYMDLILLGLIAAIIGVIVGAIDTDFDRGL